MLEVKKFQREHLLLMDVQEGQSHLLETFESEYYDLIENFDAYSIFWKEELLGCAGMIKLTDTRGEVWSLISKDIGRKFIHFHRVVKRYLDANRMPRVESSVDSNLRCAHRWMKLLEFKWEGTLRNFYGPEDSLDMYARYV